ncbi:cystatin-B-like [Rhopilema esculentum]|uniref:cystatin-B-like n=1 Tax=Rhopilema esculentum TaxID=499914 RepID=UPI0031D2DB79
MKCGGTADAAPADEETQKVIDTVKQEVEQKLGRELQVFKALRVARQMVQGFNFFVKVDIGNNEYIHVRIYQNLPCYGSKIELHGIQVGKTVNDDVGYFEGFQL